jgi:tRNA(Ile)-lysidine synthase TilS/MesJ
LGCNKLALAHHADDVAQTTLLNLFYQGKVTTMYPRVPLFGGNLTIIRPLAYVSEQEIRRYARVADFPPSPPPCPTGDASQRALMRQIVHMVEKNNPHVRAHLWRAAKRHQVAVEKGSDHA